MKSITILVSTLLVSTISAGTCSFDVSFYTDTACANFNSQYKFLNLPIGTSETPTQVTGSET